MSVFDKFNVNPYIRTYAGAPIGEFNQVAGQLQQRMETNLDKSSQLEIAMNNLEATNADEAFKQQKIAEYQKQIEAIAENPEYATGKVRALARDTALDEDFKLIDQNNQIRKAMESAMDENDYSDFQTRKYRQALADYEAVDPETGFSGAAAGRRLGAVNFYDEQNIGDLVDDRVNGIVERKFGRLPRNADGSIKREPDGSIITSKGEVISEERVKNVAMGVLSDQTVLRQVSDEFDALPESAKAAYGNDVGTYFLNQYGDPSISKYAVTSLTEDIKGVGSASNSNNSAFTQPVFVQNSGDVITDRLEGIRTGDRFIQTGKAVKDRLAANTDYGTINDIDADMRLKETLDAVFEEMITSDQAGLSGNAQTVLDRLHTKGQLHDMIAKESGVDNAGFSTSIMGGVQGASTQMPTREVQKIIRAEFPDYNEDQLDRVADEVSRFVQGSLIGTDMTDMLKKHTAAEIATPTQMVTFDKDLAKGLNLQNLNGAVTNVVQEFVQNDKMEAIKIEDGSRFRQLESGEFEGLDLSSIEVTSLAKTGAPGVMQVRIDSKEKGEDPKLYRINVNSAQSNISTVLANQFMQAASQPGPNQGVYNQLAFNFGQQGMLESARGAVNDVGSTKRIPLASDADQGQYSSAFQTPALYLMQDPASGNYFIENASGTRITKELASRDQVVAQMINMADAKRQQQ